MSITLYNQYIYKNGEWKLVGTSIDPPTKTSDLTNDSGFITAADIPVESVNGETGAVVLDAADVGAQAAITANGILKGNGSGTITAATAGTDYQAPLPSQTGNSGKYLTTNGTAMSWGEVDALPSQTGNSGKFLTTDGTDASWTSITQDDHKWGTATLDRTQEGIANDTYVPQFDSTSDTTAKLAIATKTPANYAVAKYDGSAYLHSTTPTSSDNSTKVATTAYVDTAVGAITYPVTSVNTKTGAVSLTASDVGALPDDTTIPQGTVTSVRVQATSPVQSSTNTVQSTTLNTTISLADSYGDTKNPYAAKAKNTVLAGPSTGTATAPSFRTLEADDIPSLTVSKISDFPSTMTPSSHTHGNITNDGDITTTATIASGDRLVINDESASKVTNSSITFGTSETTYLTNKGTWKTPDYPVTSVNTKTGAVSLTASDVGALPDTTEVPTATSDLTNDSGFITSSDIPVTSVNTKTGAVSLSASDVGALPDSTDVTKWNGVELNKSGGSTSQNIYIPYVTATNGTTAVYAGASTTPTGNYIAKYDANSYLHSTTPSASDNSTKVATTAYVDSAINELGSLLTFKGVVATTGDLPGSGNDVGDVWVVSEDNSEHVWTGEAWERLGTTVDLSGYVPTSRTVNGKALSTDITLSASDVSALPDTTDVTKWNGVELDKTSSSGYSGYVPYLNGTTSTTAQLRQMSATPSSGRIAVYNNSNYLTSTTPSAGDNSTKVATTAYVDSAVSSVDALPSQTGNSGKFLTTDGSDASWADVPEEVFIATYETTTYADVLAAYNAGKTIFVKRTDTGLFLPLTQYSGTIFYFYYNTITDAYSVRLYSSDTWQTGSSGLRPVTSVNSKTGAVTLTASDVGALPDTYTAPVTSVNTKTGAVTLSASDVGALPDSTEIPTATSDLTNDSGFITINDVPAAPVTSVNTKTGAVTLTASDVGALPDSTSIPTATSDLTNDSGFITANDIPQEIFIAEYGTETFANIRAAHVAGKIVFTIDGAKIFRLIYCTTTSIVFVRNTGSPSVEVVTVSTADEWASEYINAQSEITASGILKGDGAGGVTAAVAGTDYQAPISNNVTGSGTSGYLAKFNGTNTVTSGPALGSATTTFLRNDGSWATPAGTYSLPTASTSAKGGIIVGSGLTMSTDTLNHASSITAGTAGTSSATSGSTLAVPYVTYNATGHITAAGTHTHTINGLGVSAGGTGATTFTSGYALIGNGANAITTRAITNNTATSSAVTGSTNLVTMNTLRYATNRATSVAAADTNYTTYMARGEALNSSDTNPSVNGAISWTYS